MTKDQDPLGLIGVTVENKYKVLELAGEGGFSAVYKAEHLIWNEPVAVKFFNILDGATEDMREGLLADFIQEGKLMSRLSSRSASIVQARDIGKLEVDGQWIPYMVLEWVEGVPLDVAVREERARGMPPRTLPQAMSLLDSVATALDVAHQEGVAHRDLKPANVVIMGDPFDPNVPVKVLDFGIAKVMADQAKLQEQLQLTGQQITAFTPNYGAPEQFSRNFGATGPWTDVFAMALILVELMRGGEKALEGASFFELGVKACDGNSRPTPQTLGLEVPANVEAVFAKALALHPKDRYSRMSEFWGELYAIVFPNAATWQPRPRQTSMNTGANPAVTSILETGSPLIASTDPSLIAELTSADTQATPEGEPLPSGSTQAALTSTVGAKPRSNTPLIIGTVVVVAALAGGAMFALSGGPATETAPTPAGTGAPTDPPVQETSPAGETEAETAAGTAAETAPEASAEPAETGAPSATAVAPRPRVVRPRPPTPKKDPKPKAGADAWDPSSFGGR
jgi:serine/threonine protein kinase